MCMYVYVCVCICMYVYVCVCTCMYVYVRVCTCMYVYVCLANSALLHYTLLRFRTDGVARAHTVSFHNFKSQIFELSVSNPKSKYVAYLSVLSQI